MHLQDGILTALFAASWLTAAVALTADSITQAASSNVIPLGAPAVSGLIPKYCTPFYEPHSSSMFRHLHTSKLP